MIISKISGSVPVVVFVGPAACGKSMVLQSLVDMLRRQKLAFEPDKNYLRSIPTTGATPEDQQREWETDKELLELYEANCDDFNDMIEENASADSNNKIALKGSTDQILVNVKKPQGGQVIIKLLEAPGEHFFSVTKPGKEINDDVLNLISGERDFPIYYVILLDLHTQHSGNFTLEASSNLRRQYSNRVVDIITAGYKREKKDRLVFLYNKSDLNKGTVHADKILPDYYQEIENAVQSDRSLFGSKKPNVISYVAGRNFRAANNDGTPKQRYSIDNFCKTCAEALWKELNPKKSLFKFFS